jgi:hypothetical protein
LSITVELRLKWLVASAACVALIALSNQNLSSYVIVSRDQAILLAQCPKRFSQLVVNRVLLFNRSLLYCFSIGSNVPSQSNKVPGQPPVSSDSTSSVNWRFRKRGNSGGSMLLLRTRVSRAQSSARRCENIYAYGDLITIALYYTECTRFQHQH